MNTTPTPPRRFLGSPVIISSVFLATLGVWCLVGMLNAFRFNWDSIPHIDKEFAISLPVSATNDTIDLGAVNPDNRVIADFELVNNGLGKVFVKQVATDCGCTTAGSHVPVILPHQKIAIPITFDPVGAGRSDFVRSIVVTVYNDVATKDIQLKLKGNVNHAQQFVATPGVLHFGSLNFGDRKTQAVVLYAESAILNEIPPVINLSTSSPVITVPILADRLEGRLAKEQKSIEIQITVDQNVKGTQQGHIRFAVAGVPVHRLSIPWKANVVGPLTASRRHILLKAGTPQSVVITTSNGVPLSGVTASCDLPTAVSCRQVGSGDRVSIEIVRRSGANADIAAKLGVLRVHAAEPVSFLEIPVIWADE